MTRREVLQSLLALPVVIGCGNTYRIVHATEKDNVLTIDVAEFSGQTPLLVRSRSDNRQIFLVRDDTGKMSAFLGECTHKGCDLELQGSAFACPCHGSEFDLSGMATHGPATRPLKQLPVRSDEKAIHISLI